MRYDFLPKLRQTGDERIHSPFRNHSPPTGVVEHLREQVGVLGEDRVAYGFEHLASIVEPAGGDAMQVSKPGRIPALEPSP